MSAQVAWQGLADWAGAEDASAGRGGVLPLVAVLQKGKKNCLLIKTRKACVGINKGEGHHRVMLHNPPPKKSKQVYWWVQKDRVQMRSI